MERYRVEPLDEYIRLQQIANDHQIRAVISFSDRIDSQRLCGAIRQTFACAPVLGCRYVPLGCLSRWESLPSYADEKVLTIGGPLVSALADIPDPHRGPQIRAHILREPSGDTLVLTINHMACDGGGFKEYLYLLAQAYRGEPLPSYAGASRRLADALRAVPLRQRAMALLRRSQGYARTPPLLQPGGEDTRVRLHTLRLDDISRLHQFCRKYSLTINDMVLALFAWAVYEVAPQPCETLSIQTMVDLRRYAAHGGLSPFANFSSMETVHAARFDDVVSLAQAIAAQMCVLKAAGSGLRNITMLSALLGGLPRPLSHAILTHAISAFSLSTSNLGVLDAARLRFGDLPVAGAYILTSIKLQPALQLSFSTFGETMTLSILGRYSAQNSALVERLLAAIRNALPSV